MIFFFRKQLNYFLCRKRFNNFMKNRLEWTKMIFLFLTNTVLSSCPEKVDSEGLEMRAKKIHDGFIFFST